MDKSFKKKNTSVCPRNLSTYYFLFSSRRALLVEQEMRVRAGTVYLSYLEGESYAGCQGVRKGTKRERTLANMHLLMHAS